MKVYCKKVLALSLALVMCCVFLCSCGISRDDAIGTWSGTYVYEGNEFSVSFVLSGNGEYSKVSYKNGEYYKAESGTWEIERGDVLLHENGNEGTSTRYELKGDALVNNNHKFYKS